VEEVCRIMAAAPDWAEGLPLDAAGFGCEFYKKD
jgi:DNA polymerase